MGRTFKKMDRVGKFLIFTFDTDLILISHLRMEGKYIDGRLDEPDSRYARVVFELNDGTKICYDDSRCFGTMQLSNRATYLKEPPLSNIGPEPFNIDDPRRLLTIFNKSSRPIKELLLDQTIMTGLGNIYVDEVLFLAKIHPELPGNYLTLNEVKRLLVNSNEVLAKAIAAGGSTIRTYHAAKGVDGRFQQQLFAYNRAGKPCLRCQTPLAKIKVKGRGSTFCPRCQINRSLPLVVAITGAMHAGKSTILRLASEAGYPTISSDAMVKQLYAQPASVTKVAQLLHTTFPDNRIDSKQVLDIILTDPPAKKRLEKWVHPIIKAQVLQRLKEIKAPLVFVEVPLLFDAKWDYLAHYIIGVTTSYDIQTKRIKENFAYPELALKLAATNQFAVYQNRVDELIVNDGTQKELQTMAEKAINHAVNTLIKTAESANF
jgi:formamidopyrimidine-DNA glycosylase